MKLRSYQQEIYDKLNDCQENTIIQLDTGTGKTPIQIMKAVSAVKENKTVIIMTPNIELIRNFEKYRHIDPAVFSTYYCPVNDNIGSFVPGKRLYIGTFLSMKKHLDNLKPDLVIHDEAHHGRAKRWESLIDHWGNALHLGFTATPVRFDGKSLKKVFPRLITGPTTDWFIQNGYLASFRTMVDPQTVQFHSEGGGDELDRQQSLFDDNDLLGNAVETLKKHNPLLKKTIVFATGEDHCFHLQEAYNKEFGSDVARVILGNTKKISKHERNQFLWDFEHTNKHPILINIDILTEGVDVKTAEFCQLCRYTGSLSRYRQMNGRVARYLPEKIAWLLDHAGNVDTHMAPNCPIDWESLYYAEEEFFPETFDRKLLQYNCAVCDRGLIKLGELRKKSITILCECGYANVIKQLSKKQLRILNVEENIDLQEYDVPITIQKLLRIVMTKKMPNHIKIQRIVEMKDCDRASKLGALESLGVSRVLAEQVYLRS